LKSPVRYFQEIKWLKAFINKEAIAGLSVTQIVNEKMEWCAEAYMKTDYSRLTEEDFIKSISEYVAFKVKYDQFG
jgi:type I restriction enzyme M protein